MKKIKNYLLSAILVLAPSLLLAHPGHEHHGTGLELMVHFVVTFSVILALGVLVFRVVQYVRYKKNPAERKQG